MGRCRATADRGGLGARHRECDLLHDEERGGRLRALAYGRFRRLGMQFRFAGISQVEANALVQAFTDACPIYNTIARTTPTEVWGEAT